MKVEVSILGSDEMEEVARVEREFDVAKVLKSQNAFAEAKLANSMLTGLNETEDEAEAEEQKDHAHMNLRLREKEHSRKRIRFISKGKFSSIGLMKLKFF